MLPLNSCAYSHISGSHTDERDSQPPKGSKNVVQDPTDIAAIPDIFSADPGDRTEQTEVLEEIIKNSLPDSSFDTFLDMRVRPLRLSKLRDLYDKKDTNVVNLLSRRNAIEIDEDFKLKFGTGRIHMDTKVSTIDYHLTVANCIGLSPLLPNSESNHLYNFDLDLQQPYREFKYKHAVLGFDPAGRMLYIGRRQNEDVYLAMVPNEFFDGRTSFTAARRSKASTIMSTRHYRQIVMMFAHFLADIPLLSYHNLSGVYKQKLDTPEPKWANTTDVMYVFVKNTPLHHCPLSILERRLGAAYRTCFIRGEGRV